MQISVIRNLFLSNLTFQFFIQSSIMEAKLVRSKSQLQQALARMKTSELARNYKQAQEFKDKAEKLKKEISKLEQREAKNKNQEETVAIKNMQAEETVAFNKKWEAQLTEMQNQEKEMKEELQRKHQEELKVAEQTYKSEVENTQYLQSGKAIALQNKEKTLAKLEQFIEAHQVQQQRLKLEEQQTQDLKKQIRENYRVQLKKLKTKQANELNALIQKITAKTQEAKNQMEKEKVEMKKKHKNILFDFVSSQKKQNLMRQGQLKNTDPSKTQSALQRVRSTEKMLRTMKSLNGF